jgi:hypothetical protein
VVKATIRFKSFWAKSRIVASTIANEEMANTTEYNQSELNESSIRHKPKRPSFTIKPLNRMENSTEASTCAFSNQEKNGHTGILTPNPIMKNKAKSGEIAGDMLHAANSPPAIE